MREIYTVERNKRSELHFRPFSTYSSRSQNPLPLTRLSFHTWHPHPGNSPLLDPPIPAWQSQQIHSTNQKPWAMHDVAEFPIPHSQISWAEPIYGMKRGSSYAWCVLRACVYIYTCLYLASMTTIWLLRLPNYSSTWSSFYHLLSTLLQHDTQQRLLT